MKILSSLHKVQVECNCKQVKSRGRQANADNCTGNVKAGRSPTFPEAPSFLGDKLSTAEPSKLFPRLQNTSSVDRRVNLHTLIIFCLSISSLFFFFFLPLTTLASVLLKRLSHAGQGRRKRDEMRLVLHCVLSYWPLYPKLFFLLPSIKCLRIVLLAFFCCRGWSGIYGGINGK